MDLKQWGIIGGLYLMTLTSLLGQAVGFDEVFVDYIKTVRFHVDGLELSSPMVELNSNNSLFLSFDDMEDDGKRFYYKITLCNKDWTPSNLSPLEYLDGFEEGEIENFSYSSRTLVGYVNYELLLPNNDVRWTKSGNYLLSVYNQENNELVFNRRFVVFESIVNVTPKMVRPSNVSKMRTHQEIDFNVDYGGFNLRNPRMEVTASILQNYRWDNAIQGIGPFFDRFEELGFDYQDKIVFQGSKEFRFLDLRSLRFRNGRLINVERTNQGYQVALAKDQKRNNTTFFARSDLNGNFVIQNNDYNNISGSRVRADSSSLIGAGTPLSLSDLRVDNRSNFRSDYAEVLFAMYSPTEYYNESVYLVGKFTDWQIKEEYKMVYNNSINSYVIKQNLKQGYYDYMYAKINDKNKNPVFEFEDTEGNSHETNNIYTILIYYSPFGARYDRVIGMITFTSGF